MKVKTAYQKNMQLQEEKQRLTHLGEKFCIEYDLQSINFITQFIPQYLEYYVNSQNRDKYANLQPLISITNSPLRNIFTRFDLNLLFPERIWEFSITTNFLQYLTKDEQLSNNILRILYLIRLVLSEDFQILKKQTEEFSQDHLYRFTKIDSQISRLPYTSIYRVQINLKLLKQFFCKQYQSKNLLQIHKINS